MIVKSNGIIHIKEYLGFTLLHITSKTIDGLQEQQYKSTIFQLLTHWAIQTKLLKSLILITIFLSQFRQINTSITLDPFKTKFYEPPYIQTKQYSFVPSNPSINSTGYLGAAYTMNFDRVHLQSSNNRVISSIRNLDYVTDNSITYMNIYSNTNPDITYNTSFILQFQANSTGTITIALIKINLLIVAQQLSIEEFIIITGKYTTPHCNGAGSSQTCPSDINFLTPLPSTNYKIFQLGYLYEFSRLNIVNLPVFKFITTIVNTTHFNVITQVTLLDLLQYQYVILLIALDLFDVSQKKPLMFSVVHDMQIAPITNLYWDITFSHLASDVNVFVNIRGFGGGTDIFLLNQNTTVTTIFKGYISTIGSHLYTSIIAFYGYTTQCPTYLMTYPCQTCSSSCLSCHVFPSFHCELCDTNYILDATNTTCLCNLPFLQVSGYCDLFPIGCITGERLLNGTAQCTFCIPLRMTLNSNYQCECATGYQINISSGICEEYCGDGFVLNAQCDDGNTFSNDGCDSSCMIEAGYTIDNSTSPPTIKSQVLLQYQIKEIIKDQFLNSATIKLQKKFSFTLPYPVLKQNFQPLSSYMVFKILTPYKQIQVFIQQIQINSDNQIYIKFDYDFTVETLGATLSLRYQRTRYVNQTQKLFFKLEGQNKPLKFQSEVTTYKSLGEGLLAGSIINVLCLLVGLLSPKFIGLESILTLQLIYYSQLLIYDIANWPPGFSFLKYLKIAGGYNDILEYTEYFLQNSLQKKMKNLFIKKLVIQNFNINFIILIISSILLCIFTFLRNSKEKYVTIQMKEKIQSFKVQKDYFFNQKIQMQSLKLLIKFNQACYWIGSQITFWLLIPLMSTFGSAIMIPNSSFQFITSQDSDKWFIKFEGIIIFASLFMIFGIGFNKFVKFWLSLYSYNRLIEKPEQIAYKRILFIYLLMQGNLIFFFYQFKFSFLYCSVLVLIVHSTYLLLLLKINPYKQSLRIHSICLIFNQVVYLVFLVVINLINYLSDLNSLIILLLAYFITFCCGVSIVMTIFRLYYQLRYGPALQEEIQQERNKKKVEEKLRQELLLKRKQKLLEEQAKLKITQKQRVRQKNDYLLQNQINDEKKIELLNWLETRNWDQKAKQIYYFKRFTEKPLKWLQQNDQPKYIQKIQHGKEQFQTREKRKRQADGDPQFKETVQRLKKQLKNMKTSSKQIK